MPLQIERAALDRALLSFARAAHGLILGRAGVGKSFSLSRLARSLESAKTPYLVLGVEDLGDATETDVRTALAYEEDSFAAAIEALFTTAPEGTVIFDGFDAARNEAARTRLLGMIRSAIQFAPDGWTVVVSARDYDARKSPTLIDLFRRSGGAAPKAFQLPGVAARHFAIPELTDEEVESALPQIPGLEPIYRQANEGFHRLARVPFNLWLLDQVLKAHAPLERVGQLQSEVQLLDLYWSTHVTDVGDGDHRAQVLQSAVRQMIASRSLTFAKADVFSSALAPAWTALFSDDVLVESGPGKQSAHFSHNILFDYAVSVLAIPTSAQGLVDFLVEDPSRPLFLRPSLLYYFVQLWYARRDHFWECFWRLLGAEQVAVKLVSRLLPPYVVASQARSSGDLDPLILRSNETKEDGPKAILRVLQALRVAEGADPSIWAEFSAKVASAPSPVFAWELATYLGRLLADSEVGVRSEIRSHAGDASRNLFRWAWDHRGPKHSWYDALAPAVVLPLVLKTAKTDVSGTTAVVRQVLTLLQEPDFPIRYLNVLAEGTSELSTYAPDVVAEVYRAVFFHEEKSTDPTSMGGIVLTLTSNRRQDFGMCRYALARDFLAFLESAPPVALAVGLDVLNAYSARQRRGTAADAASSTETFSFRGKSCLCLHDGSVFWSRFMGHEDEGTIENALETFLQDCAMAPDQVAELAASHARSALTWVLFLKVGASVPSRYGKVLFELALARPLQMGFDTRQFLASFVEAAASVWTNDELERFQKDALDLKEPTEGEDPQEYRDRTSDLLLTRVPSHLLSLDAARARVEALTSTNAVPENKPPVTYSSSSHLVTPEMWLSEEGVDLALPKNASLFALATKLKGFIDTWVNKTPPREAVEGFAPELTAAFAAVSQFPVPAGQPDEAHASDSAPARKAIEYAWTQLAASAHTFARAELKAGDSTFELTQKILVRAAGFPPPVVGPERDREFSTPSWSGNPRTESIQGLSHLAFHTSTDPVIAQTFASFAGSPEPAERFLVAWHLPNLRRHWLELFWETTTNRAALEVTPSIVAMLIRTIWMATYQDERGPALLRSLIPRWQEEESSQLRQALAESLARLAFVMNDQWSWTQLRDLASDPVRRHALLSDVISDAAQLLVRTKDSVPPGDPERRVVDWLLKLLEGFKGLAATARQRIDSGADDPDATKMLGALHGLVGEMVMRVHFGARADLRQPGGKEIEQPRLFVREYIDLVRPIMRGIIAFADPAGAGALSASAAHHFMQLLNVALPFGPEEALAMAAKTATSASVSGYQFDSLAVKEVIRLVETVLADYRDRLASGEPLSDTLTLLDVFADAGWPEALRLVWRLDEVFR